MIGAVAVAVAVGVAVGVAVAVSVGGSASPTVIVRRTESVCVVVPMRRTRSATRCWPFGNVLVTVGVTPSSKLSSASRSHAYSSFAPVGFLVVSVKVTGAFAVGAAGATSNDASRGWVCAPAVAAPRSARMHTQKSRDGLSRFMPATFRAGGPQGIR